VIKRALFAFALALLSSSAIAQTGGSLPTQQFAPAPGGDNNYVTVQGTAVLPAWKPSVGLFLNYANQPLVLRRLSNGEEVSLIEHQLQVDLIGAIGIADVIEVGIGIPLTIWQASGDPSATLPTPDVSSVVMGDIRLYPKWSIVHDPEGFGIALLAVLTLPSGSPDDLQGNESITLEPRVVAGYQFNKEFRGSLSAGFLFRPEKQDLYNIAVGNELTFGAGLEYRFDPGTWGIILEGYGKVSLESGATSADNPIELALAGRWWPAPPHAVTLGVARGLTDGYGAPNFRVFLGYTFTPKEDNDPDGDGLLADADACPSQPEDFDGFQDEDGCPDRDNDKDGVLDVNDGKKDDRGFGQCMNDPEDFDGFQDTDGCPDPDNDGDGILDGVDGADGSCKNDPEDVDGFEDEDGCPDPDNDQDKILDPDDKCPNEPEDIDNFQDEDGCPDPDNDGDGILDVDDNCPNDPENKCNVSFNPCEIVITDKVYFRYDKYEIDPKSFPLLDAVASVMLSQTWIKKIEVQGHTDSDGTLEYNDELSQNRAKAVLDYLTSKKVGGERLVAKGYGERKPIASNATKRGRAKNRRVQFIILDPSQSQCAEKKDE